MYTEVLPGGQQLALIIPSLTETMAGTYYCTASYANTKLLEASVNVQTYGKYCMNIIVIIIYQIHISCI